MVADLGLAGKAKRTVYGYLRAVRKLADFCETAPYQLDEQDVRDYLLHLIVDETATNFQCGPSIPRPRQRDVPATAELASVER